MSSKKRAARRLSLLAGSSLVAAGLAAVSFTAAPTVAYAYDECVPADAATLSDGPNLLSDPTLNLTTPDSFSCTDPTYSTTGITYSSSGNLLVTVGPGSKNVGAVGIDLTGNGTNDVRFVHQAASLDTITGTSVATIDVTSVSGDIILQTGNVNADAAGMQYGIRAASSGGGDITITRTVGQIRNTNTSGQAAIEAITNGGNISITTAGNSTAGYRRGIRAVTDGAGSIALTLNQNITTDFNNGVAGLDLSAGSGGINVQINSGSVQGSLSVTTGVGIIANSTGNVLINNTGGNVIGAIVANTSGGGTVTFNSQGTSASSNTWLIRGATVLSGGNDRINLTGTSSNLLDPGASIDMGAGADIFTLASTLNAKAGTINLGAGADIFNASGFLNTNGTTINFGADSDTFNLSGRLSMNNLTLSGLENFNNSGLILMGLGLIPGGGEDPSITDSRGDDILRLSSGTFTGSGAGRVVLDVLLGGAGQVGCETATGVTDCLDFRGASTAGVTTLTVNNIGSVVQLGGYDPVGITLVDVNGAGTSGAGHFVLDPASGGFIDDPLVGGSITVPGLFRYTLQYDPDTQRHVLVGLPGREALEYAVLSGAAQSIWRMTTETVTDRQTDLREGAEEGSLWLRSAAEYSKRDMESGFESFGQTYSSDNSYKLYAGVLMVGADLLTGTTGRFEHALGFQAGYVSSSMELTDSESTARFTGGMGGVYGSLWNDWFFVNGTANINGVTLDYDAPALGVKTTTFVNSFGAAAEAGARTRITENTFVEPLVAVSWVRTSFEEISLRGGEVEPGDSESLRAGVGARLGATLPGETVSASYYVAGRAWNEFEGESGGMIHNPGVDLPFTDEFTGSFGEAEAGISVFNAANTLSGFLTSGVKWKDGYSAVNLSLGVRMAW